MKVRATQAFAGASMVHNKGDEFELPEGTDLLETGLVVPVKSVSVETAAVTPAEKQVTRKGKDAAQAKTGHTAGG